MSRPTLRIGLSLLCVLACSDGVTEPHSTGVRLRAEWLTGAAAANWDPSTGQFRLPTNAYRFVSPQNAAAWSAAYTQLLVSPSNLFDGRSMLEQDRGGPMSAGPFQPCARQVYVTSAFGLPPSTLPAFVRRAWSNAWSVTLCGADGTAQVAIGVADDSTTLRVVNGALVVESTDDISQFIPAGIPARYPQGLPVSPELAVQTLVLASGRRVAELPIAYNQLDDNFMGSMPFCASWRVTLDQPVAAQGLTTGARYQSAEYYVRNSRACYVDEPTLYLPLAQQQNSMWILTSSRGDSALVPLYGPVRFEPVTLTP